MFEELSLEVTKASFWFFTVLMCLILNLISPPVMPAIHAVRKRAATLLAARSSAFKNFLDHRKKVRKIVVLHYLTTPEVRTEYRHQETRSRWLATQSALVALLALLLSDTMKDKTPVLSSFLVIVGLLSVAALVIHWRKAGKMAATIDEAFDLRNAHSEEEMVKVIGEFLESEKQRLGSAEAS